jgi:hypothetical protein
MTRGVALVAIVASFTFRAIAQISLTPKPIDDTESYAVYAALLPSQWTVRVARAKILVFQQETTTDSPCMPSGTPLEVDWRDAMESFRAENAEGRVILPGYDLGLPYVVVAAADIRALREVPNDPMFGWSGFYKRYPDSGGFMQVSAVGFDTARVRAMVSMAHSCGGLCGGGTSHLLQKIDGVWREVKVQGMFAACMWAS